MTKTIKSWWPELALIAGFVALTLALIHGWFLSLDLRVADWAFAHQPTPVYRTALGFNQLGQGGKVLTPVSLILSVWLAVRQRTVRAFLPFIAANVLTYVTIGPLKIWAGRAAPAFTGPNREIMFNPAAHGNLAMSYPSGHMGNSLVWYATIALLVAALLRRPLNRWQTIAIRYLPPVILFCTTVYTGFHWLTDSIAGVLLGLLLVRIVHRIPFDDLPPHRLKPAGFQTQPNIRPSGRDA